MNTGHESHIAKIVLEKVRTGGVRMHSRAYFIARVTFVGLVAALALALSAWVVSFILFSVHQSGQLFLLGYGMRGAQAFFLLFPWALLALDIALVFFLQWLMQEFKLAYRTSVLTVFFYVLGGSLVLAAAINISPAHSTLLQKADRGELPLIGDMYEGIRYSHHAQGIFRGTVVTSSGPTSTIVHNDGDRDTDDGTHDVVSGPATQLDAPLRKGDKVYIFGTEKDGEIRADGIRHLSDEQ